MILCKTQAIEYWTDFNVECTRVTTKPLQKGIWSTSFILTYRKCTWAKINSYSISETLFMFYIKFKFKHLTIIVYCVFRRHSKLKTFCVIFVRFVLRACSSSNKSLGLYVYQLFCRPVAGMSVGMYSHLFLVFMWCRAGKYLKIKDKICKKM